MRSYTFLLKNEDYNQCRVVYRNVCTYIYVCTAELRVCCLLSVDRHAYVYTLGLARPVLE